MPKEILFRKVIEVYKEGARNFREGGEKELWSFLYY